MTTINDGGQAFPGNEYDASAGMSLRDWFAGQALTDLAHKVAQGHDRWRADDVANAAYWIADAMLKERAREGDVQPAKKSA